MSSWTFLFWIIETLSKSAKEICHIVKFARARLCLQTPYQNPASSYYSTASLSEQDLWPKLLRNELRQVFGGQAVGEHGLRELRRRVRGNLLVSSSQPGCKCCRPASPPRTSARPVTTVNRHQHMHSSECSSKQQKQRLFNFTGSRHGTDTRLSDE